jgi:hypothetical protein
VWSLRWTTEHCERSKCRQWLPKKCFIPCISKTSN